MGNVENKYGPQWDIFADERLARVDLTEDLAEVTSRSPFFGFEERGADSALVEAVWKTPCEGELPPGIAGCVSELFPASRGWGLVFTREGRRASVSMWGPGTRAMPVGSPGQADLFGIVFKPGTFMPHLPPGMARDTRDFVLPDASSRTFWLGGASWEIPDFDNADTFVTRLVREGLLVRDPLIEDVIDGREGFYSQRSIQRRFLRATGLTITVMRQIERARIARRLLRDGVVVAEVIAAAGFYDQAHLTREMRRFMGQTPGGIARESRAA